MSRLGAATVGELEGAKRLVAAGAMLAMVNDEVGCEKQFCKNGRRSCLSFILPKTKCWVQFEGVYISMIIIDND